MKTHLCMHQIDKWGISLYKWQWFINCLKWNENYEPFNYLWTHYYNL